MTSLRLAVVGAAGRMGQALTRAIAAAPGLTLAAAVEHEGHAALGTDAGEVAGVPRLGVALRADLEAALEDVQVLIDFAPGATEATMRAAAARGVAAVVGTTGLGQPGRVAVTLAAHKVPIVLAPNMSVGMNVLFALVAQAAQVLGPEYSLGVFEIHHKAKRDAPSGTALRIAEVLRETVGREVPTAALRGGDVVGEHTVHFLGLGERLEVTHRAESRENFARGALRAAQWVQGKAPALYDMQDVLGLR
ncbi:MAG TPA: 4-hydroxy-tetrahydrodipicolinate reductase [Polyangia bacterium]|jgi:4-hydroxy-tetrahydrodipicolinate reductase